MAVGISSNFGQRSRSRRSKIFGYGRRPSAFGPTLEEIKDTWSRKENRTRQKKVNPPFWSGGRRTENLGVHVVLQDLLKEQDFLYFFQNLVKLTLHPLKAKAFTEEDTKDNLCVILTLRFCERDTKFLRNHHLRFVLCSNGQIYGGDFAKFCGLLRIYEL